MFGETTDELKLVPTQVYGPLKRAQDATACPACHGQGLSPRERTDQLQLVRGNASERTERMCILVVPS